MKYKYDIIGICEEENNNIRVRLTVVAKDMIDAILTARMQGVYAISVAQVGEMYIYTTCGVKSIDIFYV